MADPLAPEGACPPVDEAVLQGVITSQRVESPYSQFGTLVAKVRTLFPHLVTVARDRSSTDHGAITRECGIHPTRQGAVLAILGHHEAELGRPLLPAVVTTADGEMPGEWYLELVEQDPGHPDDVPTAPAERQWLWETQREDVYRAWTDEASSKQTSGHVPTIRQIP